MIVRNAGLQPLQPANVSFSLPEMPSINIMRGQVPGIIIPDFSPGERDVSDCDCPRMGCGRRAALVTSPPSNLNNILQAILANLREQVRVPTISVSDRAGTVSRPNFSAWSSDPRVLSELTAYRRRSHRNWPEDLRAQGYSQDFQGYAEYAYYNRPAIRTLINSGRIPDPMSLEFTRAME